MAREALGKSQRWLAIEVDVDPSTVNRWEKGLAAPRDHHKIVLARVLKTNYWVLFPLDGYEPDA